LKFLWEIAIASLRCVLHPVYACAYHLPLSLSLSLSLSLLLSLALSIYLSTSLSLSLSLSLSPSLFLWALTQCTKSMTIQECAIRAPVPLQLGTVTLPAHSSQSFLLFFALPAALVLSYYTRLNLSFWSLPLLLQPP